MSSQITHQTSSRPLIIALTGRPMSGKDSVACELAGVGGVWEFNAFAALMRREVAWHWGVDIDGLRHRHTKEIANAALAVARSNDPMFRTWALARGNEITQPRSLRWLMQMWGDFRRAHDADYFVRPVRAWLAEHRYCNIAITDVRMPNEWAMLKDAGAHLVRVHRPGLSRMLAETAANNSEQHTALVAEYDIHNDGNFHHLEAEVHRVVAAIQAARLHADQAA